MASFKVRDVHWDVFIEFFNNHPDFASGKLNCATGRGKCKQLWEQLTSNLNGAGYGEKTVDKWQKTWSDYKCNLKKKAAEIKRARNATGGGPEIEKKLTEQEMKILALLGNTFFEGCNVAERGLDVINVEREQDRASDISQPSCSYSSSPVTHKRKNEICDDHDYLFLSQNSTPSNRAKHNEKDELKELYKETISAIKEIGHILSSHLNEIKQSIDNLKCDCKHK